MRVVVPFAGPQRQFERLLGRLAAISLRDGDEIVVVDNRSHPAAPAFAPAPQVRVLTAAERASSWYARNRGAAETHAEWLLFIDADTRPAPDLLDRFFDPVPASSVGVIAGGVRDWTDADTRCARYISARQKMDQRITLENSFRPYAQTANCAVLRAAFEALGGFSQQALAAGDADLCWRLQAAGWTLDYRPGAYVEHENRVRFRDLFRQLARHGSGLEWLERRYPGSSPRPRPRELLGRIPHYARLALTAPSREQALFALADLASLYACDLGRLARNLD